MALVVYCFSSTLVLDKKLVHVVYSKLDRDVLVIAMPAERCVYQKLCTLYVPAHVHICIYYRKIQIISPTPPPTNKINK